MRRIKINDGMTLNDVPVMTVNARYFCVAEFLVNHNYHHLCRTPFCSRSLEMG